MARNLFIALVLLFVAAFTAPTIIPAASIATTVLAAPAASDTTSCVNPDTIGAAGLWHHWYVSDTANYYALDGGVTNDVSVTPLSGQLTERRGPNNFPMPPGKLTQGQPLAYW